MTGNYESSEGRSSGACANPIPDGSDKVKTTTYADDITDDLAKLSAKTNGKLEFLPDGGRFPRADIPKVIGHPIRTVYDEGEPEPQIARPGQLRTGVPRDFVRHLALFNSSMRGRGRWRRAESQEFNLMAAEPDLFRGWGRVSEGQRRLNADVEDIRRISLEERPRTNLAQVHQDQEGNPNSAQARLHADATHLRSFLPQGVMELPPLVLNQASEASLRAHLNSQPDRPIWNRYFPIRPIQINNERGETLLEIEARLNSLTAIVGPDVRVLTPGSAAAAANATEEEPYRNIRVLFNRSMNYTDEPEFTDDEDDD